MILDGFLRAGWEGIAQIVRKCPIEITFSGIEYFNKFKANPYRRKIVDKGNYFCLF